MKNPMQLPVKLRLYVEDRCDPVAVFRGFAETPCVTFNEYLLYGSLLDEVAHLKSRTPAGSTEKLQARFSSGARQLVVSWRGRPADKRRSVLIAHVDQEGFLVREFNRSGTYAVCWHTAAKAPEEDLVRSSEVRLVSPDTVALGRIEKVRPLLPATPENPFDHEVVVRIENRSRAPQPEDPQEPVL
jgi:hypothetical protein